MPGTIREFKVYDETRHPPEWTSLVGAAACAVFMKDVETSTPLSRDGAVVLPKDCTFLRFDHFAEAREFCEAQVQRYPAMCCEIFDAQGKAKPPLLTVVHPSRAQKDGLSHRWLSRRTIAIVSILCAVPLFVLGLARRGLFDLADHHRDQPGFLCIAASLLEYGAEGPRPRTRTAASGAPSSRAGRSAKIRHSTCHGSDSEMRRNAEMMQRPRMIFAYVGSVIASIAIFFWIRFLGRSLSPANVISSPQPTGQPDTPDTFSHVLLAVVVVIVAARAVGAIFRKLNQPPVMGEVLAGILLGPSFFGFIAPFGASFLLPPQIAPYLAVISQVGVILYMFLVGLELDTDLLRQRTQASIAISHASMVVPFLLGAALALLLYPLFSTRNVSFTVFALFLGVAMSVTAFPVLARILTDRNMQKSPLGVLALACAAVDDVSAWCLLALVVGVIRAQPGRVLLTVALTIAFILFVLLVVKRGGLWLVDRQMALGKTTRDMLAIVCVSLLLAGLTTEQIGIHAVFGAFLIGTVIPQESALAHDIREKCEDLVVVLLLPVFFAFTGMRTQVGLLKEPRYWLFCLLIMVVASLGKFGGGYVAARWAGSHWREAASLGVLLNTRGLMELVVLNLGLDLGVLSPALFTMFVLMAVTTTLATTPILHALTKSALPLKPAPPI